MSAMTAYLMVGVLAAIAWEGRESEPGPKLTGMMMLLVAWPVFMLAALAITGFRTWPARHRAPAIPTEDLRSARTRGAA